MIELTEQQAAALADADDAPARVVNPRTRETFVLLPAAEYARLTGDDYDDSPWTRDEMESLTWEAGKSIGWEDMDEYDQLPEKS